MTIATGDRSLNAAIDRWFMAPEPNAAGRLGLFRILFAAFYLWHLSSHFALNLAGLPSMYMQPTLLIAWAPAHTLPSWAFQLVEAGLVAALVVLLIGYRTRLATLAVLILGSVYEAWHISIDGEHAPVMLAFYIPFFMLLSGRWGDTYSLDSHLRQRAGLPAVDPADGSWPYFLPARAVLVVLAALFFSAAVFKVAAGGTWLERPDLLANIMLDKNIKAAIRELPLNPLAPFISQQPLLYVPLQYSLLLFEAVFFLALFGRRMRDLILSTALVFHAVNALWLVVTFTPVLIAYGLFVDWQRLRERLLPRGPALLHRLPAAVLVGGTLAAAVAAGVLWNTGTGLRSLAGVGGLLDWRTIWYVVLPFAVLWWVRAVGKLLWPSGARPSESGLPRRVARQASGSSS